jgi:hypothetical protein
MTLRSIESEPSLKPEAGSFRDRNNRVFYFENRVLRGLSANALSIWQQLSQTAFFQNAMENQTIVQTKFINSHDVPNEAQETGWSGFLEHDRIPFISYPYEWPFSMLKDAAILHLELLSAALQEGFCTKDGTAYNIQWAGAHPVFIDTTSLEPWESGEPWLGYRQFCQLFLYPLMLQSYKQIPYHSFLRGSLEGISPALFSKVVSFADWFRPGVFTHGVIQSKMQAMMGQKSVKSDLKQTAFSKELIQTNIRNMLRLVRQLKHPAVQSEWSDYTETHSYSASDHEQKIRFVKEVASSRHWPMIWDLGCNTGQFSKLVSAYASYVVAMDADPCVVERLYTELKTKAEYRNILPLYVNLADPSPGLGWRNLERKPLEERGTPSLTLCLALIHHLVISCNIPMSEFIDSLAKLNTDIIIEFVDKEDPMVQMLLQNRVDQYHDYNRENFEALLSTRFKIEETFTFSSGTRMLYYGVAKTPSPESG